MSSLDWGPTQTRCNKCGATGESYLNAPCLDEKCFGQMVRDPSRMKYDVVQHRTKGGLGAVGQLRKKKKR